MTTPSIIRWVDGLLLTLFLLAVGSSSTAVPINSDLPIGAWAPYSSRHLGPCYLADNLHGMLFTFPIIVGMEEPGEFISNLKLMQYPWWHGQSASTNSNTEAPFLATTPGIVEAADGNYGYWRYSIPFTSKEAPNAPLGVISPRTMQGGLATVECWPAFAGKSNGLLIRITLSAPKATGPLPFVVDLMGGVDPMNSMLKPGDISVSGDMATGTLTLASPQCPYHFVLAARTDLPIDLRTLNGPVFDPKITVGAMVGKSQIGLKPAVGAGIWADMRISGLMLSPGKTMVLPLAIGVGKNHEEALESAEMLLSNMDELYKMALAQHEKVKFQAPAPWVGREMAQLLLNLTYKDYRRTYIPSRDWGAYASEPGGNIALALTDYRPDLAAAQLNAWFLTMLSPTRSLQPVRVPPSNLFALWQLYERTHDKELLRRFYPYAKRRYVELYPDAGTADVPWKQFDWAADIVSDPAGAYRSRSGMPGLPLWNHIKTLSGGPATHFATPDYAAEVLRSAAILLRMAVILNEGQEEEGRYRRDIHSAIAALNRMWDPASGFFEPIDTQTGRFVNDGGNSVMGLLPLITGHLAIKEAELKDLLRQLENKNIWSQWGVRSLASSSPSYRPDYTWRGGVSANVQWMIWKGLLDLGEAPLAARLAQNVTSGWQSAITDTQWCPAFLNGGTGKPEGWPDSSGDASAIIPLADAMLVPGTVSTGWDTEVGQLHYDEKTDKLMVELLCHQEKTSAGAIVVMGKPEVRYRVGGAVREMVKADATGVVAIDFPTGDGVVRLWVHPAIEK